MKIICSKDNLAEGINTVQKAVSTKTTLPILEGILIEAADVIKLTGNDLELGIECFVEGDIREKGSIVINSKILGDIIRRLPESEVLIEVNADNTVTIECDNSHFEIKGIPAAGYPAVPTIEKKNSFESNQLLIKEMIRQTIFAVGVDGYRPIFTGSLVECKNGELNFVSIDGFRVALRSSSTGNENTDISVVVPGKTLNEISKILKNTEEKITVYISENQILFDTGKFKVVSRLLEGEFFNYRYLINNDYEAKVKVDTKNLLSSIERASLITADEKEKNYPVKFSITDDKIIITSNTRLGSVREEVSADMNGNRLEISYNPKYFIDALRAIDDEMIEIYFAASPGACTIRPVEGQDYAYIILPLRG